MPLNTTHLLNQVKIKATLPEGRYTDAEILDVTYDVLLGQMVPLILSLKEEYYVRSESQNITINTSSYSVPYRAYGLALREVKRISSTSITDLYRIDPTDVTSTQTGTPSSFYLEGQDVVLYPAPSSTVDILKLSYFITPSKPVQTTEVTAITAINTATGIITATPVSTWTASNIFDLVSRRNGYKCLAIDISASVVGASSITFSASDLPSSLAVGDFICLSAEAPFLQIPDSGFGLMVQMIANELLEDLGDMEALQVGQGKAEQLKASFIMSLSTRVLGAPKRSRIRGI
jgi:hypothetical protein